MKVEGNGLPASNPVPKAMPKRVKSEDSQQAAVDDGQIQQTGNLSYRDVASFFLNAAVIDEAYNSGTMIENQVDLFREHLRSVVDMLVETDVIFTFNSENEPIVC